MYHVQTEVFEGPLDLLLSLIEKRKLFINDISIATVTDDYLRYLEDNRDAVSLAETAQFVLVGSTLLLIKSRSLLPVLSVTEEEQGSMDELERSLQVLAVYRAADRAVARQYGLARMYRPRRNRRGELRFSPGTISVDALSAHMRAVLAALPVFLEPLKEATVRRVVSLEEMMDRLTDRINKSMELSFSEFAGEASGKVQLIVSFLAMLELVRQGVIRVEQGAGGDIQMSQDHVVTPQYT